MSGADDGDVRLCCRAGEAEAELLLPRGEGVETLMVAAFSVAGVAPDEQVLLLCPRQEEGGGAAREPRLLLGDGDLSAAAPQCGDGVLLLRDGQGPGAPADDGEADAADGPGAAAAGADAGAGGGCELRPPLGAERDGDLLPGPGGVRWRWDASACATLHALGGGQWGEDQVRGALRVAMGSADAAAALLCDGGPTPRQLAAVAEQGRLDLIHEGHGDTGRVEREQAARAMLGRLRGTLSTVRLYATEAVRRAVLAAAPVWRLAAEAAAGGGAEEGGYEGYDARLLRLLCTWFKRDFFKWVDKPACGACGGATEGCGRADPTPEEQEGLASIVEVYRCKQCATMTRFPRLNSPLHLLRSRRGRCGEWANCFAAVCHGVGWPTRQVVDWTDHVWVEVWCHGADGGRWLHADPCEGKVDAPLMYERGWGKKLSYCIGFSADGDVADVTRRYTERWGEVLGRRNDVPEAWLAAAVASHSRNARAAMPAAARTRRARRAAAEATELAAAGARAEARAAKAAEEEGRLTGSIEWRAARGELGKGAPAAAPAPAPAPAAAGGAGAARYRYFRFTTLLTRSPDAGSVQLSGLLLLNAGAAVPLAGALAANPGGESPGDEGPENAIDGRADSKWLDFRKRPLIVALPEAAEVTHVAFRTGNDCPERDPTSFAVDASEDGEQWCRLATADAHPVPDARLAETPPLPLRAAPAAGAPAPAAGAAAAPAGEAETVDGLLKAKRAAFERKDFAACKAIHQRILALQAAG